MIKQSYIPVILACLTILTGCNVPPSSETNILPNPTSFYQTISAGLTATSEASFAPTAQATATSQPETTQEPMASPYPSLTSLMVTLVPMTSTPPLPCNRAAAGRPEIDISVPDGTQFKPGESFSKTWRLINSGSCVWTRQYSLVWFSGEQFGSTLVQMFADMVPSGGSVDLTVDLIAPESPGIHQTNWKLRSADGTLFGLGPAGDAPFWARIEVEETPQEQNLAPAITQTPTPIVVVTGSAGLSPENALDLDSGESNLGEQNDLALLMHDDDSVLVMPVNGARMNIFGTQLPTELDCSTSTLSSEGIQLKSFSENTYICYRTNQGLPGVGKVTGVTDESLLLVFTTWMVP